MEARLTELEIKVAYQERLLETLNQVVVEQRGEIDGLWQRVARLEGRLASLPERDEPADEPPPHY